MDTDTDTDVTTNSTRRLPSSNISIHHYCFVVRTNTIIYNNQQQKEKESDKGCYYCLYCSHHSTIQYIINCTEKVSRIKLMTQTMAHQLTTRMMTTTNTTKLSHNYLICICICFYLFLHVYGICICFYSFLYIW